MDERNKRKNTRVVFHTTADLQVAGRSYKGCQTENLSLSGVFVLGVSICEMGEAIEVTLHLSGSSSKLSLHMKARVVRCEEAGVGLQFFEIDLDSFQHLKNIIFYNTQDPDKFEAELPAHIPHPAPVKS